MDEDAMDGDLVAALRFRGVAVFTALDAGLIGKTDEDQLAFAAAHECTLHVQRCRFLPAAYELDRHWARARGHDFGAATVLLNR